MFQIVEGRGYIHLGGFLALTWSETSTNSKFKKYCEWEYNERSHKMELWIRCCKKKKKNKTKNQTLLGLWGRRGLDDSISWDKLP